MLSLANGPGCQPASNYETCAASVPLMKRSHALSWIASRIWKGPASSRRFYGLG